MPKENIGAFSLKVLKMLFLAFYYFFKNIFSTSNDKNPLSSNMLNLRRFSTKL